LALHNVRTKMQPSMKLLNLLSNICLVENQVWW